MRITSEEKAETRKRILATAKLLFRTRGFDRATTRDIAKEVGIATGTMFNYFRSKEAIVVELASHALEKAGQEFTSTRRKDAHLAELLFASVAAQLRSLRPLRNYIRPLLDTVLSPVAPSDESAIALRADLNAHFVGILNDGGLEDPSSVQLHILWSLYVGVLTFWSTDKSPKQEDSLALLDQSARMFVDWIKP